MDNKIKNFACLHKGSAIVGITRTYGAELTVEDSRITLSIGWPFYNLHFAREQIKDVQIVKQWGRIDIGIRIYHKIRTLPPYILFSPKWWPTYVTDIKDLGKEMRALKANLIQAQYLNVE